MIPRCPVLWRNTAPQFHKDATPGNYVYSVSCGQALVYEELLNICWFSDQASPCCRVGRALTSALPPFSTFIALNENAK